MQRNGILGSLVLLCFSLSVWSQNGKNLGSFEYRKVHFGCALGFNATNWNYKIDQSGLTSDSIQSIQFRSGPGLAIHLPMVSWNPHPTFHLRTIPSISFHESSATYTYQNRGVIKERETRIEPTFLNFPVLVKLSTKRLTNFAAYALTGASYSVDLTTNQNTEQIAGDPILKLNRNSFQYHVGGGFDFYLMYFKFGLEIKLTNGINNMLIQDETFFSTPLESVKPRIWWFSFTFEG